MAVVVMVAVAVALPLSWSAFNGRFLKLAPARKLAPRCGRITGTVDGCRTAGGRSSDGQRTVVGGAHVVSGAEKKII